MIIIRIVGFLSTDRNDLKGTRVAGTAAPRVRAPIGRAAPSPAAQDRPNHTIPVFRRSMRSRSREGPPSSGGECHLSIGRLKARYPRLPDTHTSPFPSAQRHQVGFSAVHISVLPRCRSLESARSRSSTGRHPSALFSGSRTNPQRLAAPGMSTPRRPSAARRPAQREARRERDSSDQSPATPQAPPGSP